MERKGLMEREEGYIVIRCCCCYLCPYGPRNPIIYDARPADGGLMIGWVYWVD